MTPERLKELINHFPACRIAVIGDFFLDKYLDTDPRIIERSVESGQKAHQVVTIRHSPGAAGTVVENLAALDAGALYALGIAGDDGEGFDLFNDLYDLGCRTDGLIRSKDRMTPTYLKPRNMDDLSLSGEHERYDTKNRTPTPNELVQRVIDVLDSLLPKLDAVIISDQVEMDDCGVITSQVREALANRAEQFPDVVFIADSRAHIKYFRKVIIKPNEFEVMGWENPLPGQEVGDRELEEAVLRLRSEVDAPICASRGARGMFVSDPKPTAVSGVKLEGPTDITGAGDSSLAGVTLALASGAGLTEAALVGNLVASITVQQLAATGAASREELPERLEIWHLQGNKL